MEQSITPRDEARKTLNKRDFAQPYVVLRPHNALRQCDGSLRAWCRGTVGRLECRRWVIAKDSLDEVVARD